GDISSVGTIVLTASKPHAEFEIFNYADPPPAAQSYGSYTIEVLVCPVPSVPGVPEPRACVTLNSASGPSIADLNFSLSSGDSLLLPDSARADSVTWLNVPPGTYTINQNSAAFGIDSSQMRDQTLICCQAGAFVLNLATDQFDVRDTLYLYVASNPVNARLDSDGDGVADEDEIALLMNPHNPDTDGDGLNDGDE